MLETLQGYALMIDSKTWMILGAIVMVLGIISLVKKVVHFAFILITAALLFFGASYINTNVLKENSISIKDGVVYVMDQHFELDQVKGITFKTIGESKAQMIVSLKDGSAINIQIPLDKIDVFQSLGKALGVETAVTKKQ